MAIHRVIVKPLNISSLDDMFLNSFASFINSEFPDVLFIALSEDAKVIYLISVHISEEDLKQFLEALNENPYIEDIQTELLSEIVKGKQLYRFKERWLKSDDDNRKKKRKGPSFDDDTELEEEEEKRTMEITLNDDEELKF